MFLSTNILRHLIRPTLNHLQLTHQFTRLNTQLTPISCHLHFLRNFDETKTGFNLHLHRAIHSSGALCWRNSYSLGQKVDNEKKIDDKTKVNDEKILSGLDEAKSLGLFARFKKMAKEYWYVLIPVHVVTSCFWLGGFYYASKSGVDIVGVLESYNFSETIIKPLRNSHLGHIAVAYFCYKIATPARYFVTLGGTTFTIKQGIKHGLIKPMPSKDKLVQIYKDKKDDLQQNFADKKQALHDKKQELQDKYMKKD